MLIYVVKSVVCSLLFWLIYKTVFECERMHRFNRFYLLGALAGSLLIPLVNFTVPSSAVTLPGIEAVQVVAAAGIAPVAGAETTPAIEVLRLAALLPWAVYLVGVGVLLTRFVNNLRYMFSNIRRSQIRKLGGVRLVEVAGKTASSTPYTFMNYIFTAPDSRPEEEILCHEMAHARGLHSLDRLAVELVRIVFWFNPAVALYRRAIDLNHEYLADEAVLNKHHNVVRYQTLLIRYCSGTGRTGGVASNFNSFINTKKRLLMMTKSTSRGKAFAKQLIVIPLCTLALGLFAGRVAASGTASVDITPAPQSETLVQQPKPGSGATRAQLDEYKKLAARGIEKRAETRQGVTINMSRYSEVDLMLMAELYQLMTPEQQREQEISVIFPGNIEIKHPTQEEMETWKNEKEYGMWIDGKRVENSEISKYKPSDIGWFHVSVVTPEMKDYGKYTNELNIRTVGEVKKINTRREAMKTPVVTRFDKETGLYHAYSVSERDE